MSAQLFALAALAWFAFVVARTLWSVAWQTDCDRRDAPARSRRRYGLTVVAAALDATCVLVSAVGVVAACGFIATAVRSFVQ